MSESESTILVEQLDIVSNKEKSPVPLETNEVKTEIKTGEVGSLKAAASEDSEYETLEEDNGGSSRSSRSRRSSFSDELSDDIAIEDEREDGDGQEENSSAKDKKLDDDEDRRNPQYIPKKGTFYEHDDRTMADEDEGGEDNPDTIRRDKGEEGEKDPKVVTTKKGKVWTEKADRWTHDLYVEDEQKPKSTQELIDTYGYDIRNEEAPPKARRRRRYGRGPNKYTRNWEDEDAYTRSAPPHRPKTFHNNREEFPDLVDGRRRKDKGRGRSKSPSMTQSPPLPAQPSDRERTPRKERTRDDKPQEKEKVKPAAPAHIQHASPFPPPPMVVGLSNRQEKAEKEVEAPRVGRGRGFRNTGKPRPTMEFTASRGRATIPPFSKDPAPQVQDSLKHAADMLIQDFSHVYISNNNNANTTSNIVEETIIPRSERRSVNNHMEPQEGSGRSKRYSTQRQRSLPDSTPPPAYSPPHNIPYYTQPPPPPSSYVPAPVYNEVAPPPVTSPPMQMVAFLPPGPPPTGTAAPPYPPPPLLNYMPPPTFPPMALQPPIPGQFDDLAPPAELYQGQGGITYYSTQSQSVVPRPNPPRRVKLAIPIVPPPDNNNHKRGSGGGKQEVQSAAS